MSTPPPLIRPSSARDPSPTLSPNLHVRTIVELLRAAGPDLGRRWLAALLLVPESERESVVRAIEVRIARTYAPPDDPAILADTQTASSADLAPHDPRDREFVVVYPSRQHAGHAETVERTYAVVEPKPPARPARATKRRAAPE